MKDKNKVKAESRLRKARRVKSRFSGTAERPRLVVYRSARHIYAQLVDDAKGVTLASSGTNRNDFKKQGSKVEASKTVGENIAEEAKKKNISSAVFDRNGFLYHGRVKAVAEGAREKGLKI